MNAERNTFIDWVKSVLEFHGLADGFTIGVEYRNSLVEVDSSKILGLLKDVAKEEQERIKPLLIASPRFYLSLVAGAYVREMV